jgi:hypothetical protein
MLFCAFSAVPSGWRRLVLQAAMHTVHTDVYAAVFELTTPSYYRMLHTRPLWFKLIRIQLFTVLKATKWHTPPLITVPHPKPLSPSQYSHCRHTNIPTNYALLPCIIKVSPPWPHILSARVLLLISSLSISHFEGTNQHVSIFQQNGVIW